MYTIKSVSEEGTYYLSSDWKKNNALWVKQDKLKERMLFKSISGAKTSLKRLLETMTEYLEDTFTVVEIVNNDIKEVGNITVQAKEQEWKTIVTLS